MSYLLSNNKITKSEVEYIKDFIKFNMAIKLRGIPYFDGGVNHNVDTVLLDEIKKFIDNSVINLINRLSDLRSVTVNYQESVIASDSIQIKIKINNIPYTYDIATRNS